LAVLHSTNAQFKTQEEIMIPSLFILILLTSIMLGLSLIAVGAYVWLVAKKMGAGILLFVVGLILTSLPIALITFFTITRSVRR
jgi:hypothetical protein